MAPSMNPSEAAATTPDFDVRSMLQDHFTKLAPVYEEYGPHWSEAAKELLKQSPIPTESQSVIHDNGCGTGIVSIEVLKARGNSSKPPKIYATDWSQPMIDQLRKLHPSLPVQSLVLDSEDLSSRFGSDFFTHSFTSLVLMVCANQARVVKEIHRTLKPGGFALASTFANHGAPHIVNRAIQRIKPGAPEFTGPATPPEFLSAEWLESLFVEAGFDKDKISMHKTQIKVEFKYWSQAARRVFAAAHVHQAAGDWTESERERLLNELIKSFTPGNGEAESFDHEIWICVARK